MTSGPVRWIVWLIEAVPKRFCLVAGYILLAMGLLTSWSVILRYLVHKPIVWTYEAGGYVILACSAAGVAYALQQRRHIGVDLFVGKLRPTAGQTVRLINLIVTVAWGAIVLLGTWTLVLKSIQTGKLSEAARIPIYPFELVVPVGMVIFLLIGLIMISRDTARLINKEPPEASHQETPQETPQETKEEGDSL